MLAPLSRAISKGPTVRVPSTIPHPSDDPLMSSINNITLLTLQCSFCYYDTEMIRDRKRERELLLHNYVKYTKPGTGFNFHPSAYKRRLVVLRLCVCALSALVTLLLLPALLQQRLTTSAGHKTRENGGRGGLSRRKRRRKSQVTFLFF